MRGEVEPGARWRDTDRLLFLALERYERSIHKCGQPLQISTDQDAARRYELQAVTCHACAVLEEAERNAARGKGPSPGRLLWVTPDQALRHAIEHPLPEQYGGIAPAI